MKIESVENGSIVMKISVGTIAAVNLIAALTWSGAVVYKTILEGREKEQIVRQRIIQNNHLIDVSSFYKQMSKIIAEDEAIHLYNEHFKGQRHDQEQINRTKHSIELLSEELSKGAEIHPVIESSAEIIKSFPDMKNLPFLESRIKRIENVPPEAPKVNE